MRFKLSDENLKPASTYKESIPISEIRLTMKGLGITKDCAGNSSKIPV